MEIHVLDQIKLLPTIPTFAVHSLISLSSEFLCSNAPLEKLKSEIDLGISKISESKEILSSPAELQNFIESITWYIESRYSRPYDLIKSELDKFGIFCLYYIFKGISEEIWNSIKIAIKKYRKSLINQYEDNSNKSVQVNNGKLLDFNYEFISIFHMF